MVAKQEDERELLEGRLEKLRVPKVQIWTARELAQVTKSLPAP